MSELLTTIGQWLADKSDEQEEPCAALKKRLEESRREAAAMRDFPSYREYLEVYFPKDVATSRGKAIPGRFAICFVCGAVQPLHDSRCWGCALGVLADAGWIQVMGHWVCPDCEAGPRTIIERLGINAKDICDEPAEEG